MIYTSYYANYRKFSKSFRIGISRTVPINSCDLHLIKIAPEEKLLKDYKMGVIDEIQYTRQYTEQLRQLYKEGTLDSLVSAIIKSDIDVVLLCYENSSKFCHRHILSNFLNLKYNLKITEL